MKLSDVISAQWLNASEHQQAYAEAAPFPHIAMPNFIKPEILEQVASEFPDLAKVDGAVRQFQNEREIKYASIGMHHLSPAALHLNSYLQSDLFLEWLNTLTGIEEPLISDPYLAGGGYHEIKRGGLLKVHADFNKHPKLDLDRRLNMLIYLNKGWEPSWGGELQLFDDDMSRPTQKILPVFNTAVIFTTTSFTYHGHPDPLNCPEEISRRSLAYYYFSTGRPSYEISTAKHSTLFKGRKGEDIGKPPNTSLKQRLKQKIKKLSH